MFLSDEDYKVVIGDAALKVISQTSDDNRRNAKLEAIEEISGYLRPASTPMPSLPPPAMIEIVSWSCTQLISPSIT